MSYYYFLLVIFFSATTKSDAKPAAIFVFGDSTVDVGNNNYLLNDVPKSNFPHYGIDFPGGVSTGRFCNDFLAIDYIAKAFGFQMSPPPFLSLLIFNYMKIKNGVNFASAGSGILGTTGKGTITFDEQISNFKAIVSKLNSRMGKRKKSEFLAKSLFYVSIGSNDLFALYNVNTLNITLRDQIVTTLASKFKEQLKEIYNLGARKFGVASTGEIGCIPAIRVEFPNCNNNLNDISMHLRDATNVVLKDLSLELNGFNYSYANAIYFAEYVNKNPSVAGIKNLFDACCGLGKRDAEVTCSPNTTYCSNRRDYYYWDRIHPSQALYKFAAKISLYGSQKFASPMNIDQLVSS